MVMMMLMTMMMKLHQFGVHFAVLSWHAVKEMLMILIVLVMKVILMTIMRITMMRIRLVLMMNMVRFWQKWRR